MRLAVPSRISLLSIAILLSWPVHAQTAQHTAVTPASIAARGKQLARQHKARPAYDPNSATVTVLHSFGGNQADVGSPQYNLMQATDGNLYGVASSNGPTGYGSSYSYSPSAGSYALGVAFGQSVTSGPFVEAQDGYLYAVGNGVIWRQLPGSTDVSTMASFPDSATSASSMVPDGNGNLYGVTLSGGTSAYGTIFKYNLESATLTVLHNFGGGSDSEIPIGSPAFGLDGVLYGTTQGIECSGSTDPDCGTVWSIHPDGSNFTTLYTFGAGTYSLIFPTGGLAMSEDGNLYGVARAYGSDGGIFQIVTSGQPTVTEVASLGNLAGPVYAGTPQVDANGTLYFAIGEFLGGGVASATLPISSESISMVYAFGFSDSPTGPASDVLLGSGNSFYGTTSDGDPDIPRDPGSLYQLSAGVQSPITLTGPATARPGSSFTLTYLVTNDFSSMNTCFITDNNPQDQNFPQSVNQSGSLNVTAPQTPGSYTYGYNCGGLESAALTVQVGNVATTTTVAAGAQSYVSGQTAAVTVTVAGADSTTPSAGTVALTCGGRSQGTQTLSNGQATFSIATAGVPAGSYSCSAAYSGDQGTYYAASSGSAPVTIVRDTSTTALQLNQYDLNIGMPAQITVTVSGQYSTPTGTVYITAKDGANNTYQIASATLVSGVGQVSVDTSTFPQGTFLVYATYNGNGAVSGSSTGTGIVLYSDQVSSSLTVDNSDPTRGDTVHLTDTLARLQGSGLPGGTVTFSVQGYGPLATVPVRNGVAELTVPTGRYTPGTYLVTALYNGDASDDSSTSNQLSVTLHSILVTR